MVGVESSKVCPYCTLSYLSEVDIPFTAIQEWTIAGRSFICLVLPRPLKSAGKGYDRIRVLSGPTARRCTNTDLPTPVRDRWQRLLPPSSIPRFYIPAHCEVSFRQLTG